MMKRMWFLAFVMTLVLSLTSCARQYGPSLPTKGFGYCDGTLGTFDVLVALTPTPGLYEIFITPVTLDQPGDIVDIYVGNQGLAYQPLKKEVVVFPNYQISAGFLSEQELETYEAIAIVPFDPVTPFLQQNPAVDATCGLPLPGDGY